MLLRDPQIAGECALEPATHRIAVDRGNDHRARLLQSLECRTEALCHEPRLNFVATRKSLDISPGAEEFFPVTGEDDGVDACVLIQIADQCLEFAEPLGG